MLYQPSRWKHLPLFGWDFIALIEVNKTSLACLSCHVKVTYLGMAWKNWPGGEWGCAMFAFGWPPQFYYCGDHTATSHFPLLTSLHRQYICFNLERWWVCMNWKLSYPQHYWPIISNLLDTEDENFVNTTDGLLTCKLILVCTAVNVLSYCMY